MAKQSRHKGMEERVAADGQVSYRAKGQGKGGSGSKRNVCKAN